MPGPEFQVLVTGATGFIGSALLASLDAKEGWEIRGAVRQSSSSTVGRRSLISVGDLTATTDWHRALDGVEAIVHTAARVHSTSGEVAESLSEYRRVNVDATLNLARQAAAAGARRFIFLSSIKVNGDSTPLDRPFSAEDPPNPSDAYAVSKHEAEEGLRQVAESTGLEVVIIRPPLVYGPGVKANFLSMMRWIDKGVPLPFAAVDNARSLVAVDNLVDLVGSCLSHPAAPRETFLVSDADDLSTPDLLRRTGVAMGQRVRLMSVPLFLLRSAAAVAGKAEVAERLCGSLRVDIAKTQRLLAWSPPVGVDEALKQTARYFLRQKVPQ